MKRLRFVLTTAPRVDPKFKRDPDALVSFAPMDTLADGLGGFRGLETKTLSEVVGGSYNYFEDGDILLAKVTPCFENGKKAIASSLENGAGFATSEVLVLRPHNEGIDTRYLLYLFCSENFRHRAIASMTGAGGLRRISERAVLNFPLGITDLATQRRIADFLDRETARIDLLIEKKQRLVALLGKQRAAAISSAVTVGLDEDTELVTTNSQYLPRVPATWRVWRLKHLAEIRGGLTLGRKIPDDMETTLTPYMRVANVQAGWLDLSDIAEILVTEVEKKRYRLKYGDILMNEGGDNDKLGRGAVWKSDIATCVHQNHVFAVRPYDTSYSDWISLATNARYARDFFYLHSNQSTNLASISKTNLSRFPIALPPLDQMKATMDTLWDRVGKLDTISEKTKTSMGRLKEYRSALITAAVTGQIDVDTYARSGTPDRRLDAIQEEMGA